MLYMKVSMGLPIPPYINGTLNSPKKSKFVIHLLFIRGNNISFIYHILGCKQDELTRFENSNLINSKKINSNSTRVQGLEGMKMKDG